MSGAAVLEAPTIDSDSESWDDGWIEIEPVEERDRDELRSAFSGLTSVPEPVSADVRVQFDALADELATATAIVSNTRIARRHPAFWEIVELGDDAIPLLLAKLDEPGARPLWMRLLGTITSAPPGLGQVSNENAILAWKDWARNTVARRD